MPSTIARITAISLLSIGAFLAATTAFGLYLAGQIVAAGTFPVAAGDGVVVAQVAATAPFLAAFGVANLVAAVGLIFGNVWARPVAFVVSILGVIGAGVGIAALMVGRDPFATSLVHRTADGIGMFAVIGAFYVITIVAVVVEGVSFPGRRPTPSSTAGAAA